MPRRSSSAATSAVRRNALRLRIASTLLRATTARLRRRTGSTLLLAVLVIAAIACVCALAALLSAAPAGAANAVAQQTVPAASAANEPSPRPPFPSEAKPLLDGDPDAWMTGVATLRAGPRAHDVIVQALASRAASPRRWRLAYHLMEWGTPDDLALVDDLLSDADGRERVELIAAFKALYPRPAVPVDLARVVAEFAFVPGNPPQPYASDAAGRWLVNDLALQTYYQDNLPVRVIERIAGLRNRGYESRSALADAMQKQLPGRQWADYGERLLAPVDPVPARLTQEGTLQVRLTNPEARPIVLVVTLQCFYGRFAEAQQPEYVLVPPANSAGSTPGAAPANVVLREFPVRLIAPAEPGLPRVYLRVHELNVPGTLEAQRLQVALRH